MSWLQRITNLLPVKAAPSRGRLPLPRSGTGQGRGVDLIDGQWTYVDYMTVGGRPTPVKPSDAGDLRLNPVVMSCLGWISTSWHVATPQVGRYDGAEFLPEKRPHPLLDLLRRPNPTYGGKWLFWALLTDYWIDGNAYAQIIPGRAGVAELNYLPACQVEPKPDATGYLSHYEYTVDGKPYRLDPSEMLHLRYGIDPGNPLRGVEPLLPAFREIVTDNSASDYSANTLKHPIPPAILTPRVTKDGLGQAVLTPTEAETLTSTLQEKFAAEPGKLRFITAAMELLQLTFKPSEMGLDQVRHQPEARICALFQIPANVIGLRVGLEQSTYNNVSEAKAAAWEGCLIPLQDYFAEEITNAVLRLYPGSEGLILRYDRTQVRELQEDQNAKREQARKDWESRLITLEEARAEAGRTTDEKTRAQLEADHPAPMLPATTEPAPRETGDKKSLPFRMGTFERKDRTESDEPTNLLWDAAERFRRRLLAHERGALREMRAALQVAEAAIVAKLDSLTERMEQAQASGEPVSQSWLWQERRYVELLSQIEESLSDFAESGAAVLADAQSRAVETSREHAERLAKAAIGPKPATVEAGIEWNRLPKAALERLVGFASDGSPLRDLLNELGPAASDRVREKLQAGVAEGLNPREIARGVRKELDGNRARAETICRTEVLRASREATRQNYLANQDVVTGWIWTASLSTETCPCCWAMHGSEHASSEVLDDHPNGRCVAVARTKSWAEITGDDSIPDTRPKIEDGESAFKRLPESDQREILGPGLYDLWSSGQVRFADLAVRESDPRWGTMRRAATQAEALASAEGR